MSSNSSAPSDGKMAVARPRPRSTSSSAIRACVANIRLRSAPQQLSELKASIVDPTVK